MHSEIVTDIESTSPRAYLQFRNGRLTLLQLGSIVDAEHDRALDVIRDALSRGLRQHTKDVVTSLVDGDTTPPNPARAAALRFVSEQLAEAEDVAPNPQTHWFAGLADGRDASGHVHVTVSGSDVVLLEAPVGTLRDGLGAGMSILTALNQALDRIESDFSLHQGQQESSAPPDWNAFAREINRLRQGY